MASSASSASSAASSSPSAGTAGKADGRYGLRGATLAKQQYIFEQLDRDPSLTGVRLGAMVRAHFGTMIAPDRLSQAIHAYFAARGEQPPRRRGRRPGAKPASSSAVSSSASVRGARGAGAGSAATASAATANGRDGYVVAYPARGGVELEACASSAEVNRVVNRLAGQGVPLAEIKFYKRFAPRVSVEL